MENLSKEYSFSLFHGEKNQRKAKEKHKPHLSIPEFFMSHSRPRGGYQLSKTHELVTLNPRGRENVMRSALEMLTRKPFVKVRPSWLRNPSTGRCLEIDAWNEELKLACEFQGYQHTIFPNCFHKSYVDFERQVQRDRFKAEKLRSLGIKLLEVPHTVSVKEIPSFLAGRLSEWNMLWPDSVAAKLETIPESSKENLPQSTLPHDCTRTKSTRTRQCYDHKAWAPLRPIKQTHPDAIINEWSPVYHIDDMVLVLPDWVELSDVSDVSDAIHVVEENL
jgi:hypothetical protein